jgi:L-lactate dehydrogenase complex protein LldG
MKDDREAIMSRVRGALAPLHERAALPDFERDLAVVRKLVAGRDPLELFIERIKAVNGKAMTSVDELTTYLRENKWLRGYCDPALWPQLASHFAGFQVELEFDRARVDDYAFGITRAAGAIAETGTIVLKESSTSRRLGALAPWVHVAVLARADIVPDLSLAVGAFGDDNNIIWCTGPSKTADVEGILIEGVHGPGQQVALVI